MRGGDPLGGDMVVDPYEDPNNGFRPREFVNELEESAPERGLNKRGERKVSTYTDRLPACVDGAAKSLVK